jgi:hypothetical protein
MTPVAQEMENGLQDAGRASVSSGSETAHWIVVAPAPRGRAEPTTARSKGHKETTRAAMVPAEGMRRPAALGQRGDSGVREVLRNAQNGGRFVDARGVKQRKHTPMARSSSKELLSSARGPPERAGGRRSAHGGAKPLGARGRAGPRSPRNRCWPLSRPTPQSPAASTRDLQCPHNPTTNHGQAKGGRAPAFAH